MSLTITGLRLGNYKRFTKLDVDFGGVTLITGANSSGKSVLLSSIAALCQTQQSNSCFPFVLDFNSELVSLGSYRDIVNDHKSNKSIGIGVDFNLGGALCSIDAEYRFVTKGGQIRPDNIVIKNASGVFELEWRGFNEGYYARSSLEGDNHSEYVKIQNKILNAFHDFFPEEVASVDGEGMPPEEVFKWQVSRLESGTAGWEKIEEKSPREIVSKLSGDMAFMPFMRTVQELKSAFRDSTAFLGPIRAYPGRVYRENSAEKPFDPTGVHSYQLLQQWKKYEKEKYQEFSRALTKMKLADKFEAKVIQGDLLEFHVKPFGHKEMVNMVDAGFGVSQVAPIIVRDVSLPKGGTLLVNQPEVHLHPSSQALLANYFSERLSKRKYILETHSEYMINRFRVLVMKGEVSSKKIRIIFLSSEESGKEKSYRIEINKDGSLSGAPDEFFKTYSQDSFDLAMGGFDE